MKTKFQFAVVVCLALALMLAGVVWAADVNIDSFSERTITTQVTLDDIPTLPAFNCLTNGTTHTSILGGFRDVCLNITAGNAETQGTALVSSINDFFDVSLPTGMEATAYIEWDGDSDHSTPGTFVPNGLTAFDITDGNTNTGILVTLTGSDSLDFDYTVKLYTDSSNWAELTLLSVDGVSGGQVVDMFFPFSSFGNGTGTLDTANIRAVILEFQSVEPGADANAKLIKATSLREYGDVPTSGTITYTTAISNAYHIPQGLRLGNNVDAEAAHQPSATANGDNASGTPDDEDGVQRRMTDYWQPGNTVNLSVTVKGCTSSNCYFNGWIDWNRDGDFADANEQIFTNDSIGNNPSQVRSFTVPSSGYTQGDDIFARFRICPTSGGCDAPDDTDTAVLNGEIEDYFWEFNTPNAVTLESLQAQPTTSPVLPLALVGGAAVILIGAVLFTRRGRKQTA